jgi:hypothetical protein
VTVGAQSPNVTVTELADAVVAAANVVSPLYVAVSKNAPRADGVQLHDAAELETATFTQPVMFEPFARNVTVPVALEVIAALIVAATLLRGVVGAVSVTVELFFVVPVTVAVFGRLITPDSTALTRKSYCVSASRPVTVSPKYDVLTG